MFQPDPLALLHVQTSSQRKLGLAVPTVQLAIADRRYAGQIRDLLLSDGAHRVYIVDAPNPKIDGVIAMDEGLVADLGAYDVDRCVIVSRKGSRRIASLF